MADKKTDSPGVRGPGKTNRQDWINIALDTLISEGEEKIKVAYLSEKLGCARSSYYWFFKNRADLLDSLIDYWQANNTKALVKAANKPAQSINYALGNIFACWVVGQFDTRLDFAMRDWGRRSGSVRRAVDVSDDARIEALVGMFNRFDYAEDEADIRARIVYFTQIGYEALDRRESMDKRVSRSYHYLKSLTGQEPTSAEVDYLVTQVSRST